MGKLLKGGLTHLDARIPKQQKRERPDEAALRPLPIDEPAPDGRRRIDAHYQLMHIS